jgi:hypothetical protein
MPDINDLSRQLPPDFVWGVATSAFQIEGAAFEDGKGVDLGRVLRDARQDRTRATSTSPATTTTADAGRGADAWPGGRLPLLRSRGRACSRWARAPGTRRAWRSTTACRRAAGARHRAARHAATTGTCRRRCRTGRLGIARHRAPLRRLRAGRPAPAGRSPGRDHHAQRAVGAWRCWATSEGTFAPGLKSRRVAAGVAPPAAEPRPRGARAARRGRHGQAGPGAEHGPPDAAHPVAGRPQAKARLDDARGRRWYADPVFKGRYPAEILAELGADAPWSSRATWRSSPRRSTTWASTTTRARCPAPRVRRGEGQALPEDRHGLGDLPRRPARAAVDAAPRLHPAAHLHHRERRRVSRCEHERPGARRRPPTTSPPTSTRWARRLRRRADGRLHGVEPDGQLRMVQRLRQALRHRARGLRHAGAHAQGQRAVVPRPWPGAARCARRGR